MSGRITFTIYPNQEYRTAPVVSGQVRYGDKTGKSVDKRGYLG